MTTTALELVDLPLTSLAAHPDNVRTRIPIDKEMTASIEAQGILEPLLVLPANDKGLHLIVAGHRRWTHAKKAKGVTTAPCVIRDLTPLQVIETMMTENLQRADIDPVEEARGYARMVELEATHAAIAKTVGRSARHVADRIKLLQLPAGVLKYYQQHLTDDGEDRISTAGLIAAVKYSQDSDAMKAWVAELAKKPGHSASSRDWLATSEPDRWLHQWCSNRDRDLARAQLAEKFEGVPRWTKDLGWDNRSRLDVLAKPARLEVLKLGAKEKAHVDEPCHAVQLQGMEPGSWNSPAAVLVCTHPIRHTVKGKEADRSKLQMVPSTYKDVPLRAQRNTSGQQGPAPKLKREMNQSRIEHLRKVASGELTVDPDQMLSMALQVLSGRTGEAHDVVGRILDPSLTKKGSGYTTGKQFIEDPANTSVALVLLCAGASMLDTYSSTRLLLPALLDATGYEPVAGEGEWLEKDLKAHRAQLAQREKEAAARNAKTTKPGD